MTDSRDHECLACGTTATHEPDRVLADGSGWSTCPECRDIQTWAAGSWSR